MTASLHPELGLTVSRIIRAPRTAIWTAWTDPARFAQWWVPVPEICRVQEMDLRPGGSFRTAALPATERERRMATGIVGLTSALTQNVHRVG